MYRLAGELGDGRRRGLYRHLVTAVAPDGLEERLAGDHRGVTLVSRGRNAGNLLVHRQPNELLIAQLLRLAFLQEQHVRNAHVVEGSRGGLLLDGRMTRAVPEAADRERALSP